MVQLNAREPEHDGRPEQRSYGSEQHYETQGKKVLHHAYRAYLLAPCARVSKIHPTATTMMAINVQAFMSGIPGPATREPLDALWSSFERVSGTEQQVCLPERAVLNRLGHCPGSRSPAMNEFEALPLASS